MSSSQSLTNIAMTQKCNLRLGYFHFKRSFEKNGYMEDAKPPESLWTTISEL